MPWWWSLPGFALAAIIAYEVTLGIRSLPDWLPYAVLLPVAVAVLIWLSRVTVSVVSTDGVGTELCVGAAHLPTRVMSR